MQPQYDGPIAPRIALLIVQPTPFCNIDCSYCYLPNRDNKGRLSRSTFRELVHSIFSSGLVEGELSLIWHAGEPLVVPTDVYADLLTVFDELDIDRRRVRQSIQTNAMLVTDAWCEFIKRENIHIGVSIDGPAFIHDLHRQDRRGRGTLEKVLAGVRTLKAHNIDFHVIAVVTSDSLDYPDQIFDFFRDLGVSRLGFNVEELEGQHRASSLITPLTRRHTEDRLMRFWARLFERQEQSNGAVHIREFERAFRAIVEGPSLDSADMAMMRNPQTSPLGIVSCDWQGNLSTFSPELLGMPSVHYGDFTFGTAHSESLKAILESAKFNAVARDVYDGVKACARSCPYFGLCGGGAPANKYYENGTFASTDTAYCRTTVQMPIDIVLAALERSLQPIPSTT